MYPAPADENGSHSPVVVDLVASNLSVAREKIIESRLLAELSVFMLRRGATMEVLNGQFDAQGYDVVLEAAGVTRHVQLKATVQGGKRADVDINVKLRSKPSGCVVWMIYDPLTLVVTEYRWFGDEPGESLPDLGSKVTRHSKGDAAGIKAQRPALRNLPKSKFRRLDDMADLASKLFGPPRSLATSLVLAQLRQRFGSEWPSRVSSVHGPTGFWPAIDFALLIDGYAVLEQLCEVDAAAWVDQCAEAGRAGRFSNDLGMLWTQLFVEHRRWRQASPFVPEGAELAWLDELARRTQAALVREQAV